ncbi:MAG: helix-turn-helix transcriptional regulator [Bacteroidaceae bacterium]|nr:helix-turn-helix transcriptional regulator [Bacteroidaceae bacterium]
MALLLCSAARFKSESSYVALFILFTTFPDFIYNVCYFFNWNSISRLITPIAYSENLTLMPFMLLLAHRAFNPYYKFRYTSLLHFLPAVLFAIAVGVYTRIMSAESVEATPLERAAELHSLLTGVNFIMISTQLIVYFYLIFSYLHKVKRYILSNQSQADLSEKVWIPRFITLIGALIVVAMIGSIVNPLGGFRLFYIINILAIGYLLYSELQIVFAIRNNHVPTPAAIAEAEAEFIETKINRQTPTTQDMNSEELLKLEHYAREIEEYLRSSEIYVNPYLSLKDVAKATGISSKNLSKSINGILGKNFFDLVNGFRVEKSMALLKAKKEKGLTLETIAEQCGFNSRITFNNAFKKVTGLSTSEWIKINQNEK